MKNKYLLLCMMSVFTITINAQQNWFPFTPTTIQPGNAIDMSSWLDKPAGKHGFLQMKGKDYVFEDGTPVKFWGVNIASEKPFVDSAEATQWTNWILKNLLVIETRIYYICQQVIEISNI